jgi:hypothetical protein
MITGSREWILDRFAFAARTVAGWREREKFSPAVAEALTRDAAYGCYSYQYSPEARDAFRTAFGG